MPQGGGRRVASPSVPVGIQPRIARCPSDRA